MYSLSGWLRYSYLRLSVISNWRRFSVAQIVKLAHANNETPGFLRIRRRFAEIKQNLIALMLFEGVAIILAIVVIAYKNYLTLGLTSLMVLFFLLFSQNYDINEIQRFSSYIDYARKKDNTWKERTEDTEGEKIFTQSLQQMLTNDNFIVLNDIYLPGDTEFLQHVDTIIIGPSANIYLVEVKNWHGLVSGNIEDAEWFADTSYRPSPYYQNNRNIKTLRETLANVIHEDTQIYNLVVNVPRDAYLNICDCEKSRHHVYSKAYDLFYWINTNERAYTNLQPVHLARQQVLVEALWHLHYNSLHEFELKINQRLLKKYKFYDGFAETPYFKPDSPTGRKKLVTT